MWLMSQFGLVFSQPYTENSEPWRLEKSIVDVEEMETVRTFQEDCGVIFLDSVTISSVGCEWNVSGQELQYRTRAGLVCWCWEQWLERGLNSENMFLLNTWQGSVCANYSLSIWCRRLVSTAILVDTHCSCVDLSQGYWSLSSGFLSVFYSRINNSSRL